MYGTGCARSLSRFLTGLDLNQQVGLCYMIAAAKLGLRYWALAFPGSSQNGAMTANIREVK